MNQHQIFGPDSLHADDMFEPLATLVSAWMAGVPDATAEFDGALEVSELVIDIPMELQLLDIGDGLQLHASPPTQKIETTIMPVWHRLSVRYVVED